MAQKNDERREVSRVPLKTRVVFKPRGSKEEFTSDFSENLSTKGVFLTTEASFEVGTELELHFSLPNSKQIIKAEGRVVWTRSKGETGEQGIGIEFTKLEPASEEIIAQFVERNES
ncbi:TIGR02266 family protein [Bdellovibrionota bacterium]